MLVYSLQSCGQCVVDRDADWVIAIERWSTLCSHVGSVWLTMMQIGSLLLNASLLLVLTTDYSDWLVQVTELIDSDGVFWVLMIVWLNNIELID